MSKHVTKRISCIPSFEMASPESKSISQTNDGNSTGIQTSIGGNATAYIGGNHTHHSPNTEKTNEPSPKSILLLSANPHEDESFRRRLEASKIDKAVSKASLSRIEDDKPRIFKKPISNPNLKADEFSKTLATIKPHIIDISGFEDGISNLMLTEDFESDRDKDLDVLIGDLFRTSTHGAQCVILNGCYIEKQAREIVQHVEHLIGISQSISEELNLTKQ